MYTINIEKGKIQMKNIKNINIIIFSIITAIEVYLMKNTFYNIIRFGNTVSIPINILGIIGAVLIIISLIFLRLKHKSEEDKKDVLFRILKMITVIILFIILFSLINGLIAVAVYKSFNAHKTISDIKVIINIISLIFTLLLSPFVIIFFWNGLKGESLFKSFFEHINIKMYSSYLGLSFVTSIIGFISYFITNIIKSNIISDIISIILLTVIGSISVIISEKIYDSDFFAKKFYKNTIALFLAVIITFECINPTIYAEDLDITTEDEYEDEETDEENEEYTEEIDFERDETVTDIASSDYEKDEILRQPQAYYYIEEPEGELVAASEDSRTYQVSERSFITQIGGTSFVYEDEDGDLCVVDNTLEESDDGYENKANDYTVNLPVNINDDTGIKINKDDYDIELIPLDGDFSKPSASDNAILYNDVFDGVDYQYTVLGDLIKEDIVLNKCIEQNTFRFRISSNLK